MLPVTRTIGFLRSAARQQLVQRANVSSKPPKEIVTPAHQAVVLSAMFLTFLIPSGWILAHLEDYKHKPEQ